MCREHEYSLFNDKEIENICDANCRHWSCPVSQSVNPYNMFANYAKSHSDQNPIFKFIWNIDVNNQVYKFLEQKFKLIVLTGYIKQTNNNNNNSWIMGICIIYFSYDFFEFWFFWFLCVLILSKRGIWYI